MKLDAKDQLSFLKDEYLLLQNQYEDYDRRSLTIKGWIGSGAITALALAFNISTKAALLIPVFVIVIAAIFWYLEAYWKVFQYALADRIRIIEAFFRDDPDILIQNPEPFQAYHFWFRSFARDLPIYDYENAYRPKPLQRRLREAAFQNFVMALYLGVIALSLLSFTIILLARLHPEWKLF